jgi:hypothetical protein
MPAPIAVAIPTNNIQEIRFWGLTSCVTYSSSAVIIDDFFLLVDKKQCGAHSFHKNNYQPKKVVITNRPAGTTWQSPITMGAQATNRYFQIRCLQYHSTYPGDLIF